MSIYKPLIFSLITINCTSSYGVLDFAAKKADDIAKSAAYSGAIIDLISSIDDDSSILDSTRNVDNEIKKLEQNISRISSDQEKASFILSGPNWKSKSLLQNVRNTTSYIHRLKRILSSSSTGVDAATALNTFETNVSLNDVIKNQERQILIYQQLILKDEKRQQQEHESWDKFILREEKLRSRKR
jgi:hypothetical protein